MQQRSLIAGAVALIGAAAAAAGLPAAGRSPATQPGWETSLSRPAGYEAVEEPAVEVRWGEMQAQLAGNQAVEPGHAAGYNGLIEIRYRGGRSPFVPRFAGLNLEHVNNGVAYADRDLLFEPRRHPMEIRRIDGTTYELCQAALPNTGVESCTRFLFRPPHYVDLVFECIPRKQSFPFGHLNIFWASYIQQPEDPSIYFMGRAKGAQGESWIRGVTPAHGELSTHRGASDRRQYRYETPYPLTLVFNESGYEFTRPFYYGRYGEYVWLVMFREQDQIRLTQSPSGGGQGNPAWDFQWFIDDPSPGQVYRMVMRAAYKPWSGREDILEEYRRFQDEIR